MLTHQQATVKPNILIILTDQQRADAVGWVNPLVKTPNLDKLAQTAIVCSNAFCQSPQCQPSRASIFTGRYPTAHRVWWNETDVPGMEQTIANYLGRAGYKTAYFGKLHFDGPGGPTQVARHFGFEESFLMEDWQSWISAKEYGLKGQGPIEAEFYGPMGRPTWTGRFQHRSQHHEEIITARALDFLAITSEPYLVVVGFHGPHPPYAAPDEFSGLYQLDEMPVPTRPVLSQNGHILSDVDWRHLKAQYYGAVSWIDACVGRLLAAVGLETIVIYSSDHGDILGDHGFFSKGLFAYEGNIKVPLLMRVPDLKPGRYPYLVQLIDLVPTLCKLTGVVGQGLQGVNLLDGLRERLPVNDRVLTMIGHTPRLRMVRTARHKYWYYGGQEVLFDLVADPAEEVNRDDGKLLAEMRLLLLDSLIKSEDPLPFPR